MAEPLTALSPSKQNSISSPTKQLFEKSSYEYTHTLTTSMVPPMSPTKASHGPHSSSEEEEDFHDTISSAPTSPAPNSVFQVPSLTTSPSKRSSRSPERPKCRQKAHSPEQERTVRFNEGLTKAFDAQPDFDDSVIHHDLDNDTVRTTPVVQKSGTRTGSASTGEGEETEIMLSLDDTAMGDLSTFSAVPNVDMTHLANLRAASPTKTSGPGDWSPGKQLRSSVAPTPTTARRPLTLVSRRSTDGQDDPEATPRRSYNTTDSPTDLLNFTGQSNVLIPPPGSAPRTARRSPSGRGAFPIRVNPSPHKSQASIDRERGRPASPNKQAHLDATPRRSMADLLDFDLEPMTTPKSIPTITPRELENLRSEMQSQISGLSATLSGKEAEVQYLKKTITEAEVRVGNTAEQLRNEQAEKQRLEEEKSEWERRGREMENVLREVRQEIMIGEREREKLRKQGEDAEKRAEEQEVKILELQTMLESSRRQNCVSPSKDGTAVRTPNGIPSDSPMAAQIDAAVKDATERVARELHSLYRGKHETKVEALKKSYAARWEKQVRELQENLKSAKDDLVKMQTERDATMSGVIPGQGQKMEELVKAQEKMVAEKEELQTDKKMLHSQISGLQSEMATIRQETEALRTDLKRERAEKGDLVAQVDLFLTMQTEIETAPKPPAINTSPTSSYTGRPSSQNGATSPSKAGRNSLGGRPRPMSMLKPPGKFSALPQPGKTPVRGGTSQRGGIMDKISTMGAR